LQVQHELLADVLIDNLQGNYGQDLSAIKMRNPMDFQEIIR